MLPRRAELGRVKAWRDRGRNPSPVTDPDPPPTIFRQRTHSGAEEPWRTHEGEPWSAETLLTVGYSPFALLVVSIPIVS